MGAILTGETIDVVDDASVSLVREAVRAHARPIGLANPERLVSAASELARNLIAHAGRGEVTITAIERGGVAGLEVIASDRGAGIADPAAALAGSPRTTGSLGVGVSAVRRQVDELDFDIRTGAGTAVRARSFAAAVPRSEYGVLARPHPEETTIGDHAAIVRGAGMTIGVVDGLGHGPLARAAADRAIAELVRAPDRSVEEILAAAHTGVAGSRGAVMTVARIAGGTLEHAGVGNVTARILGPDGTFHPLVATAGTLGSAFPRRVHVERTILPAQGWLVITSDGLASRMDALADPAVVREHPIVIAQHVLARFGRGTDDAIVVVAR